MVLASYCLNKWKHITNFSVETPTSKKSLVVHFEYEECQPNKEY